MILPDFLIYTAAGLYCPTGGFYLDPILPVKTAVISHAHGDHAVPGNHNVYCTEATSAIMECRLKKNAAEYFYISPFQNPFVINGITIYFIPAGHILGSAQVLMEHRGVRYLYTGDFKLQDDKTCEPAKFVHADVLITETTFADPAVSHPDPVTEIIKLNSNNRNILLGVYALGKAQRITQLINQYCPQRKVLVHHSIWPLHKIYEKYGYSPGFYEPYNRKLMKSEGGNMVYMVPPFTFGSYIRAKDVMRVFASGWKKLQTQNDMELLISDHADWNDILKAVNQVKPKELWTVHGNGSALKEYFKGRLPVKVLN